MDKKFMKGGEPKIHPQAPQDPPTDPPKMHKEVHKGVSPNEREKAEYGFEESTAIRRPEMGSSPSVE